MKTLYPRTALTALALATAITTGLAQVQPRAGQQRPDSVVAVVADAVGLPFVPPDQRPFFGAFWGARSSLPCITPPMPCPPLDPNTPVYAIGDPVAGGQFLVDETAGQVISPPTRYGRQTLSPLDSASTVQAQVDELQNFIAQTQARQAEALLRANGQMDALALDDQDGGGVFGPMDLDSYAAGDLWLSVSQPTNGVTPVVIHGTLAGENYELLSKQSLADTVWTSETNVLGAADQDWTPTTVAVGSRTNALFLWCRSWASSNGSGIPDWWLLQYFGSTDIDPYALCPSGDGWTILQAYQNQWNPLWTNTPPKPQGLRVKFSGVGTPVIVSWNLSPGSVNGYTIERVVPSLNEDDLITNLTQTTFVDSFAFPLPSPMDWDPTYRVQAHYGALGDSPWSDPVALYRSDTAINTIVVRGPQGHACVVASAIPRDVVTVRIIGQTSYDFTNFDIPITSFTNGVASLPPIWDPSGTGQYFDYWSIQTLDTNGIPSTTTCADGGDFTPFFDGRSQLANNLAFLLKEPRERSFHYYVPNPQTGGGYDHVGSPSDYAFAGLYRLNQSSTPFYQAHLYELLPFQDNYFYRNFVFAAANVDANGNLTTGAYFTGINFPGPVLGNSPMYVFDTPTSLAPIPDLLSAGQAEWTYNWPFSPSDSAWDYYYIGVHGSIQDGFSMYPGLSNYFGLPYVSAKLAYASGGGVQFDTLYAGGSIAGHTGYLYCATAEPSLSTVGYYFCRSWPDLLGPNGTDLFPGHADFSPTNTSPLMLASVGRPFRVAGYAKQLILNGDQSKFAYLGQYFDKAYRADSSGAPTTNETGVLSEYGDFLPTEPGLAILATKPDLTQTNNLQGQCPVHVISLALDANHDGTMNLALTGPDTTWPAAPFLFWLNNDHDEPGTGGNADQDLPVPPNRSDYTYGNIRCQRNLEDFFRLWVCGLQKLPPSQGYTVTLSMSALNGNPAINLYAAYGTNSGTGYLTDTNAAAAQFTKVYLGDQLIMDYAKSLAQISASQSYNLPLSSDGTPQYTNFLFEGVGTNSSSGQLTMTISQTTVQGSNVLAQTSAWLDFHDIKDFYERAVITNITTGAISNWSSAIETVQYPVVSDANESQDIVVFVHGINNTVPDWLTSSDTMFKRLYWSGYHGKFVTVHWPCKFLPWNALHPFDFNLSEFYGYKSATAFRAYLNSLRTRYPNYRIHIVAHSQGNAVASEALSQGAPFDTYILTQAAMPASSYDVNAPTNADLVYADTPPAGEPTPQWQPMGYRGIYTNLTGQIINFFNTSDYALGWWASNQRLSKPDGLPGARNYTSDGTNGYAILDIDLYRLVTDPEECRGMVSRSRTFAIGAQGPVSGQTTQGVITNSVNLQTQFGFYDTRPEHSAEFTRPIQTVRPYYLQLLRSCQIQPAP